MERSFPCPCINIYEKEAKEGIVERVVKEKKGIVERVVKTICMSFFSTPHYLHWALNSLIFFT